MVLVFIRPVRGFQDVATCSDSPISCYGINSLTVPYPTAFCVYYKGNSLPFIYLTTTVHHSWLLICCSTGECRRNNVLNCIVGDQLSVYHYIVLLSPSYNIFTSWFQGVLHKKSVKRGQLRIIIKQNKIFCLPVAAWLILESWTALIGKVLIYRLQNYFQFLKTEVVNIFNIKNNKY
ncbi:hypothetical protein AGLY_018127 [Aphis glycines]|uniref:Uncharacterized protein n=1 Tax=Aphis glycines TaxID=307491 RepID=A0A6G0ST80_APHGL|nr:hypothetical protein AGLY_018127 [Aphis glycines]